MLLILEEVDPVYNLTMSALDDLVPQLLWQIVQEIFLCSEAIVGPLIVLHVALDAVVHGDGH